MTWFSGIVIFVLTWWLVFFAALPWGLRRNTAPEEGHDAGAPLNPRLWTKVLVVTLIAAVLTAAISGVVASGMLSFRQ